jgi:hypothetical protein
MKKKGFYITHLSTFRLSASLAIEDRLHLFGKKEI